MTPAEGAPASQHPAPWRFDSLVGNLFGAVRLLDANGGTVLALSRRFAMEQMTPLAREILEHAGSLYELAAATARAGLSSALLPLLRRIAGEVVEIEAASRAGHSGDIATVAIPAEPGLSTEDALQVICEAWASRKLEASVTCPVGDEHVIGAAFRRLRASRSPET